MSEFVANVRSLCENAGVIRVTHPSRFRAWSKHPNGLILPLSLAAARVEPLPPGLAPPPEPVFAQRPSSWMTEVSPYITSDVLGMPAYPMELLEQQLAPLPSSRRS